MPRATALPIPSPSPLRWVWGVAAATLILLGLVAVFARSRSGDAPTVGEPKSPSPPTATSTSQTTGTPAPAPAPTPLETARKAVESARSRDALAQTDFTTRISLWEVALRVAEGTALSEEARRGLEAARRDERTAAEARLDQDLRQEVERENFGWVLKTLEGSRLRYPDAAWTAWIEERRRSTLSRSRVLFESVRDQGLALRQKDPAAKVIELRGRVSGWGLDELVAEFDRAVPASSPPMPPSARPASPDRPEAEQVLDLVGRSALARSYAEGIKALESAVASATDPDLKAQLTHDLDDVKLAAQAEAAAIEVLGKTPKDKILSLRISDEAGSERIVEGSIVRADGVRLELKTRQGVLTTIPFGEVLTPTLADAFLKRPGPKRAGDSRAARLLLLLEGWPDDARTVLAGEESEIADRFRSIADRVASTRRSTREVSAQKLLWRAEGESDRGLPTLSTLVSMLRLSKEYGDTAVYGRNKAYVDKRLDLGRDYLFSAEDLRKAGAFARSTTKTGLILLSESDTPAERRGESFVELEFLALPETAYRCWAYVGGCCAETLAFFAQGTELTMPGGSPGAASVPSEPGTSGFSPVKHSLASVVRTHAAHGGRKQPSRWGWAEIPLPRYGAAGLKILRLVSDQQGFAVGAVVITSLRSTPPADADLKKFLASRPELSLKVAGPPPTVWWDFDTVAGKAFADRGEGTLPLTFQSGATAVAGGVRGQAVSFDGTGFLRADPGKILNSADLTVSLWMKPSSFRGRLGIISTRTDAKETPFIICQNDRSVHFEAAKGVSQWFSVDSPNVLNEGMWTHVAVVCKGGDGVTLYVDGKAVASKAVPEGRLPWSQGIILGSESWGGDPPRGETPGRYRGLLDEIKIWTRCLRPDEIDGEYSRR